VNPQNYPTLNLYDLNYIGDNDVVVFSGYNNTFPLLNFNEKTVLDRLKQQIIYITGLMISIVIPMGGSLNITYEAVLEGNDYNI
jgi:hypothetical protein